MDKQTPKERQVPRSLQFSWGGGQIVEEATFRGQYVENAIQAACTNLSLDGAWPRDLQCLSTRLPSRRNGSTNAMGVPSAFTIGSAEYCAT